MRSPLSPTIRAGATQSCPRAPRARPGRRPRRRRAPASRWAGRRGRPVCSLSRHGSLLTQVTICVEPTQSRSAHACSVACRATRLRSRAGCQRTAGSSAGTCAGTPRSRLAFSSAMTTFPFASRAASAGPDRVCARVNAAASSAPLCRARWRRIDRAPPTALDSQPAASAAGWRARSRRPGPRSGHRSPGRGPRRRRRPTRRSHGTNARAR